MLVGGRSSRMGRDKALLPFRGRAAGAIGRRAVARSAGSATLVGAPERYCRSRFSGDSRSFSRRRPAGRNPDRAAPFRRRMEPDRRLRYARRSMRRCSLGCSRPRAESGADALLPVTAEGRPRAAVRRLPPRCLAPFEAAFSPSGTPQGDGGSRRRPRGAPANGRSLAFSKR